MGLDVDTEELVDEGPMCVATEEVIGKSTMVVEERLFHVSDLKETFGGEVAEENFSQEFCNENQTDREGPYTVKRGINDTVQGRLRRPPGQVLLKRWFVGVGQTGLRRSSGTLME